MGGFFQDQSGQWYRDSGSEPIEQDDRLLDAGIVRGPSGDYFRVPSSEIDNWRRPQPTVAPQATDPAEEPGVSVGDYARSVMSGGASVVQGVGWLTKMLGADDLGSQIETLGRDSVDYWNEGLTDAARRELSKEFVRKNAEGEYEWGDASLSTVALFGAQSLLGTAAGAGAGAGVTKVLQLFANPVGRSALIAAANSGSAQALSKLKMVDSVLGAGGFGAGEGALAGMQSGVNVYDSVMKMTPDKLMANERYQQVYNSTDDDMPELERHAYAADVVAKEASSIAGFQAGLTSALLGAPMGAFFGKLFGRSGLTKMLGNGESRLANAGIGAAGEAAQEFAQGGTQQVIENKARQGAGDDVGTWDDVLNQALGGALAGAPLGGVMGSFEGKPGAEPPPDIAATQQPIAEQFRLTGPRPEADYSVSAEGEVIPRGQQRSERLALPAPQPSNTIQVDASGQSRVLSQAEARDLDTQRAARAQEQSELGMAAEAVPATNAKAWTAKNRENIKAAATEAVKAGAKKEDVLAAVQAAANGTEKPIVTMRRLKQLRDSVAPKALPAPKPSKEVRVDSSGAARVLNEAEARQAGEQRQIEQQRRTELGKQAPLPKPQPPKFNLAIERDATLRGEDKAIEDRLVKKIEGDPAAAEQEYAKLDGTMGGKLLNTDIARELSPDYLKNRTKSAAVHQPASEFVKAMYERRLAEPPAQGDLPEVLFTAGGTGAGKSSGLSAAAEIDPDVARAQIIYDTNMSTAVSSIQKVEQALDAGKSVRIIYTYRDPKQALIEGALPRAMGQKKRYGSGRTVPLEAHADTHVGARRVVQELAERYAGDNRVKITVIDNTGPRGSAKVTELAKLPALEYDSTREQLPQALDEEHAAGRIDRATYEATGGQSRPAQQREVGQPAEAGGERSGARPEPAREEPAPVASSKSGLDEIEFRDVTDFDRWLRANAQDGDDQLKGDGVGGIELAPPSKVTGLRGAQYDVAADIKNVYRTKDGRLFYWKLGESSGGRNPGKAVEVTADDPRVKLKPKPLAEKRSTPRPRENTSQFYSDDANASIRRVESELADFIKGISPIVDVRIVPTPEDIASFEGSDVSGNTNGAFVRGTNRVYLVASRLTDAAAIQRIAAHEVIGHLSIERYPEGQQALRDMQALIAKDASWLKPYRDQIAKAYGTLSAAEEASEVIAHVAEKGVNVPFLNRVIAGMRRFLKGLGLTTQLSENDVRDILRRSAKALRQEAAGAQVSMPKVSELTPAATDAQIIAALDADVPPDVVELDTYLARRAAGDEPAAAPQTDDTLRLDEAATELRFSRAAPASPEVQKIMDRVMTKPPEAYTMRDRVRQVWDKVRGQSTLAIKQGLIDSFASIEEMEREQNAGKLLDASASAYKAALATKNLQSVMAAVMLKGVPDFVNGAYTPVAGRKGVLDIFRPLTEHKDGNLLRQWELYAAATRASRLIKEKNADGTARESLFTQPEIDEALKLGQKYPEFKTVFAEWQTFNKQMLDLAEQAGVVDPESRKQWEQNDYVPFYRAMDVAEEGKQGPRNRRGIANQRADIRRLRGSDKPLGNVFENMMMNTAHLLDASYKNRAMQRIVDLGTGTALEPVPLAWEAIEISDEQMARALSAAGLIVGNPATDPYGKSVVEKMTAEQKAHWSKLFRRVVPRGTNIVSLMKDGKPQYYEVTDPLVLHSIAGMGYDNFSDIMGLFRGSKKLLTHAITADPAFMLANFARDTLSNWVISDVSTKPLTGAISGVAATFKNDPALAQMMMAGAGGGGFYDSNPEDIRKLIAGKTKGKNGIGGIISPSNLWQAWRKIGSAAENANRVAVFRSVLAAGGTVAEAAYQARDVMNFSMAGDYSAMRWLTQVVPFLNARVQGLYRLYRGARDNKRAFFIKGSMLMAATIALALRNRDREEYEELPEWDKDTYWHIFAGGEHYRIPKPFEVGAMFATMPERLMRTATGRDSFGLLMDRVAQMMTDTFAFNPIPQLVKPVIEQYANRSMFTGSAIVGMAEQSLQPEAQFTPWTSETMRELAKLMPDWAPEWLRSPRRLEAALRSYTGALGMYVLGASDEMVRKGMGYPEEPSRRIQDLPVMSRFWKDPNPRHTKYADQLYDWMGESNAVYSTVNRLLREQRVDEARELMAANKDKLAARMRLNKIGTQVRNTNEQIRRVQLSRGMDGDAKRARIDALVERKNLLLRQVARFGDVF